ncbi:MAG TPA: cobalamin biosynthesis protein CobD, partial [Ruminococcus sp.]|nr:cobalamin biosynthesis protein CobD [Ruminococcus sp.]
GDAYYFGQLCKKDYIGDNIREIENDDIKSANKLMYMTAILTLGISLAVRGILCGIIL